MKTSEEKMMHQRNQEQVESFEGNLKKQEVEMEILREQLKGTKEVIQDAGFQAREQKETIAIFRQKYNAAIGKVHRVQGQVELLEEELQYSQQQLGDSQLAAQSAKEELAGMEQRYLEKVGHWENAQEALDQLTDELQANQTLLRECQQRADRLKGLVETTQGQVDTIKQQKLMLECDLQLHQQSHPRCDVECVGGPQRREQLQKVHTALLRQSEEQLKEVRREAARRSSDGFAQRQEVHRLQEELLKGEEKTRTAVREKQSLGSGVRELSRELEEVRSKLQVTAEELAARAEEARRMEGCLNEGKLAEEKIRSLAVRLETEVAELRRNLQRAVHHKLQAEREKQGARKQADTLLSELEETRSEKADLRHESQLVMTHVNCCIAEQKASNESLTAQMKAQNKLVLILTKQKEHLRGSNDTLKAEVTRLKEEDGRHGSLRGLDPGPGRPARGESHRKAGLCVCGSEPQQNRGHAD
ncbi:uncharacterized protein AB9W97_005494 [Spinachia spinachia]